MLERTLLKIKPDAINRHCIGEIIRRVEAKNYRIVAIKKVRLSRVDAESFYAIHKGKPFFEPFIEFMISGPSIPIVVEGENVIEGIRELIGNTDPAKAAEGTVRKDFGTDVRRNSVHASDGPTTAKVEIAFYFSEQELI